MLPPEPSAASAVLSQQTLSPLGDRPLVCSMPDVLTLAADVLNAPRSKGTGRGQEPGGGGGGNKSSMSYQKGCRMSSWHFCIPYAASM